MDRNDATTNDCTRSFPKLTYSKQNGYGVLFEEKSTQVIDDRIITPDKIMTAIFVLLCLAFLILIISSVRSRYFADDTNAMKAARHTKMLMAFCVLEDKTKEYRAKIVQANQHYCRRISQVQQNINLDFSVAVARLHTLFPHVPQPYLERVVKISANESMAVKLLITHGYPMRTFYESMSSLKKVMKTVTIRYKK